MITNQLALFCRAGFEKEVAAEITEKAAQQGCYGFAELSENSGYVIFQCYQSTDADKLIQQLPFNELIFVRQWCVVGTLLSLSERDRISQILPHIDPLAVSHSVDLVIETPDTDQAKSLLTFCRKLTVPLRQTLKNQGYLTAPPSSKNTRIHILFVRTQHCYVGYSYLNNSAPFFMGIPRLKFPVEAPSRSTLKLEEAILTLIPPIQLSQRFNENMYAVDLGACPGGWSYQLIKRGLFVYAVDHGKIAESLHATGRIEHCCEDGFKFQPPKRHKIDWLVCDMVEQPMRISQLIAKWFVNGWCRYAIFNLKLPMKKRYQEVKLCLDFIQHQLAKHQIEVVIKAKHLYHDREEITVLIETK